MGLKWRFATFLLFLSCFFTSEAHGAPPNSWEKAAKEYRKGDYLVAAKIYEKLVEEGYSDPALFYNLGKCYVKQGKKGYAILALERAFRLDPRSDTIRIQLAEVRGTLTDQIIPEEKSLLAIWLLKTHTGIWVGIAILFVWIGGFIWFARQLKIIPLLNLKRNGPALAFVALGLLFASIAFYVDLQKDDWHQAILLDKESSIFLAPDNLSPKVREVHEGTKLYILEQLNEWAKIRLENGDEGWIQKSAFEQIASFGKSAG